MIASVPGAIKTKPTEAHWQLPPQFQVLKPGLMVRTYLHPSSPISLRRQTYEYFSQGLYLALLLLLLLAVAGVHLHVAEADRCNEPI